MSLRLRMQMRWLPTLLLAALAAGLWLKRADVRRHLLGPEPRLPADRVAEETARLLFRNSAQAADAPHQARERLLALAALRTARLSSPAPFPHLETAVAAELAAWDRQWESPADRDLRLSAQKMTLEAWTDVFRQGLLDRAWLEREIAPEIQVSEAELQTAYARQRAALEIPERHRVAHLFLSRSGGKPPGDRRAEMARLHQRLLAGESWAALVKAHSEDARSRPQGGELGWVSRQRMPSAFMKAVEALKPGETSGPVETTLGWHLIRVQERRPARPPRLEEVRAELRSMLEQAKRQAAMEKLIRRLTS